MGSVDDSCMACFLTHVLAGTFVIYMGSDYFTLLAFLPLPVSAPIINIKPFAKQSSMLFIYTDFRFTPYIVLLTAIFSDYYGRLKILEYFYKYHRILYINITMYVMSDIGLCFVHEPSELSMDFFDDKTIRKIVLYLLHRYEDGEIILVVE